MVRMKTSPIANRFVGATLTMSIVNPAPGLAQSDPPPYAIFELPKLGGDISQGFGINNSGVVAGEADLTVGGQNQPTLYEQTVPTLLPTLPLTFSARLYAINDHGVAVGETSTYDQGLVATLWDTDGTVTNLSSPILR